MEEIIVKLPPIKETTEDYEAMEKAIVDFFKKEIYIPALKILKIPKQQSVLKNSLDRLEDALRYGKISFFKGVFSGKFSAGVTNELKNLGAVWDRKTSTFRISKSNLPMSLRVLISTSETEYLAKIAELDKSLQEIVPEKIADKLQVKKFFDSSLWKVEKDFNKSVGKITIAPQLSKEQRSKISADWEKNMQLFVKDFTEKEILKLRKNIQKNVFLGARYESAVGAIQKSYGVSENKAKFLARQETSLMMAKFKEVRYLDAGIKEYEWHNVAGSPLHPVRPRHKELGEASKKGVLYRFDRPPVTSAAGEPKRENNPGEDYNCRCFAIPVFRKRKK